MVGLGVIALVACNDAGSPKMLPRKMDLCHLR